MNKNSEKIIQTMLEREGYNPYKNEGRATEKIVRMRSDLKRQKEELAHKAIRQINDKSTRLIAEKLSQEFSQAVIVLSSQGKALTERQ